MSYTIFVGNLAFAMNEVELEDAFSSFGPITEAKVITDRETGRSKGFGFVTYSSADAADSAIAGMHNKEISGRPLRVNLANKSNPATQKPKSSFAYAARA
jgi:cold-inducible RNA-binding protein